MRIRSSWVIDCLPEDVYPHFFSASMDDSYPFAFRLGIPKPLSCKVLEGEPRVGNTRQCTTDRGYIRQEIVELIAAGTSICCEELAKNVVGQKKATQEDHARPGY